MTIGSPRPGAVPANLLEQALQLHQAGRLDEAVAIYGRILAEDPRQADALHLVGLIAHQRGDPAAALARIDAAIAVSDRIAEYHHNRGVVLLRLGRAADAESSFERALRLKPIYPDAHNARGNALQALGRVEEALAAYRRALAQRPDFPEAHNNLGNALRRLNQTETAIAHYRRAVELRPGYIDALTSLGAMLQDQGDLTGAESCYRSAAAQRPDHPKVWRGLAAVQRELGAFDAAIESLRRAASADPGDLRCQLDLAAWLADLGRVDEARARFDAILDHWPQTAEAEVGLARLARTGGDIGAVRTHLAAALRIDPASIDALCAALGEDEPAAGWCQRAEQMAEDERLSLRDRSRLHLALAGRSDREGACDDAFDHLARGNALRRRELEGSGKRFDAAAHAAFVDRQIATCTPEYFASAAALGNPSELPVFIVGMPRSGTTLCEQILASHPQLHALGEQLDIRAMARELPARLAAAGAPPLPYPECLTHLSASTAGPMVEAYLARLRQLAPAAARVTDKHPTNFRHLGLIATLLPRARLIHCRRDPLDTCLSCFMQDFESPIPWTCDLEAVGQYYRQYDRLMRHWRAVLPVPMFEFVYEQAVRDLEAVARRLVDFCGLPWDDRCLRFHATERPVLTASRWQVRRPVYGGSVGRWRRYARHLGPLRAVLGELAGDRGQAGIGGTTSSGSSGVLNRYMPQ